MKKLLVLGATFLQKFVIEKAVDMGYYVYVVDKNPNSLAFPSASESAVVDIVDKEACLKFAREKQVDGILAPATDYGVLAMAYVAEKMGFYGINQKSAEIIKNKYLVRKILSEKKIDCISQFYEICSEEDIEALKDKAKYPLMVKPCDGSGSKGASRADNFSQLKEACRAAMEASLAKKVICEDFIVGREYGAETLVVNGVPHVFAVMQKDMTPPPYYAELGHNIPSDIDFEDRVKEVVSNAIIALGVNAGAVNMDVLITDAGEVCVIDVGARMGGNLIGSHIVPLATGVDYLGNLIRATVGDEIDLTPIAPSRPVASKVLALTKGTVVGLPDFESIEKKYNVKVYHHLSIGYEINEYRKNIDRCGYIIATAETAEIAKHNAALALKEIDTAIQRK